MHYNIYMIFTDPYCIRLIVTEHIQRLLEAGRLSDVEPDREFGYTCRAVFGMLISEIAAIRDEDAGGARASLVPPRRWPDYFRDTGRVVGRCASRVNAGWHCEGVRRNQARPGSLK